MCLVVPKRLVSCCCYYYSLFLKKIFFRLFSLNFMAMDVLPDEYTYVHHTYTWDLKRSEEHTGSPLSGDVCEAPCG